VFTTLAHLIDVDFLKEAYHLTRKNSAPGVDGVTAAEYAVGLDENLKNLHERMRTGQYKAPPAKRVWLDKEDGSQRPIGLPAFEDKIVQRAVSMVLGAVYEQDFHDFSHGFREGHSPHQALQEISANCMKMNINWIVDADVSKFFDSIDHGLLRDVIKQRVNDGGIMRLIGKWLNAGVLEGEILSHTEKGTPQGGVISPMLANIFLHTVLDEWYMKDIKPRLRGRSFLIRFADDFIIGCELEEDARRIMAVLPKRFNRFGLTIHPKKTELVPFLRPRPGSGTTKGKGTFNFLGFTHYWGKTRRGYWVVKRKTMMKRLKRSMKSIWQWCRNNRHRPMDVQYRKLCQKLRGHYQYYGVRYNYKMLVVYFRHVVIAWRFWLSKRSQKSAIPWDKFYRLLKVFPIPRPKIVHSI
jgi:group II intron reverse transcriptase/maturase